MTNDNKHTKQTAGECTCGSEGHSDFSYEDGGCDVHPRKKASQTAGGMITRMEPNQDFSDMWHVSNGSYVRYSDHLAIVERLEAIIQSVCDWRDCCASQDDSNQHVLRRKMFKLLNEHDAPTQPANNLGHPQNKNDRTGKEDGVFKPDENIIQMLLNCVERAEGLIDGGEITREAEKHVKAWKRRQAQLMGKGEG